MNYYGENNGEVHFISLCEVMPSTGDVKAKRLADLNSNGEWERFECDQGRSAYYGNRPVIFLKDGPDQPGAVGVWEWYARPNNNDTSKDYIDARFRPDIVPIEIVELRVGTTSEEIADALKKGIAGFERRTPKVLFAVRETKYMTGILCGEDMLQKAASLVRLSGNVKRVEEYFFITSDFVYPENNKTYLKKVNPGKCHRSFLVKEPIEIVRDAFSDRATLEEFRQAGKSKREWRLVRDFIKRVEVSDIIESVSGELDCSPEEAEKYVQEFINRIDAYIDGNTIEDKVLEAVIYSNDDLMNRCKNLAAAEWQEENRARMKEEEIRRKDVEKEIREVEQKLSDVRTKYEKLLIKQQKLQTDLEEKQKLAAEIEESVDHKLQSMKDNVAGTLADITLLMPMLQGSGSYSTGLSGFGAVASQAGTAVYQSGQIISTDESVELYDWQDAVDELGDCLSDAGVSERFRNGLAAYLYASYLLHMPVLMIGPNAQEIVDVFSRVLSGRSAGILDCGGVFDRSAVSACLKSDDKIVKVLNPFSNEWASRLPEILNQSDTYFIAVYPYKEDVQIEPNSLFDFMYPLFTEIFVNDRPTEMKRTVVKIPEFKEYEPVKGKAVYAETMNGLHMGMLLKNRMSEIICNMRDIAGDNHEVSDSEVAFILLPYAVATMQTSYLIDSLKTKDGLQISKQLMDQIVSMYGVSDE